MSQPVVTSPDDLDEERRQRGRVPEVAIGLSLVLLGALSSLWLYSSSSQSSEVVQAARFIREGEEITASHLKVMVIDKDSARSFVARAEARSVIGKVAAFDIAPETPLTVGMTSMSPLLQPGESLASIALEPGQFPPDLSVGDSVVVALTSDVVVTDARPPRLFDGLVSVWSIDQPEGLFGTAIVTLRSTEDLAVELAAAGKVRLAVIKK